MTRHDLCCRWKQRDIHEKREIRKHRIAQLEADISCNGVLEPRLRTIVDEVAAQGPPRFSALTEQFKTSPSPYKPPTNAPEQKTYDEMLLALMLQVWEDVKKEGVEGDDPKLGDALVAGLQKHIKQLGEHQGKLKKELEQLEEEGKKKITSDDIHEGFDSHVSTQVTVIHRATHSAASTYHPSQRHHRSRVRTSTSPSTQPGQPPPSSRL